MRKLIVHGLLMVVWVGLVLTSCSDEEPATPAPTATAVSPTTTAVPPTTATQAEGILISELLPGVPGANSREFIELYNAGMETADLQGYSLWYVLNPGDETLVKEWTTSTEIPGYGHYLLVHEGQDFGLIPDTTFDLSLFERKGGLILRDAVGETADTLGWGDAPEGAFANMPAALPAEGASLERLPGGAAGNGANSGDNQADWVARTSPNPQNSGSPITPLPAERLTISVTAPETVEPGMAFAYTVTVENTTSATVTDVQVVVPLPDYFMGDELRESLLVEDGRFHTLIPELAPGHTAQFTIDLQSPYTYIDTLIGGYYVEAEGLMRTYGPLRQVIMAGGAVPIATARDLIGSVVSVEGVVTMYTGGFFAGSTSTKFYVEDETGGIQVFADGGNGVVNVNIGDQVRVTGAITPYRDSLELIPVENESDVEVLARNGPPPEPTVIAAGDNENDDRVLGRLNLIEGTITAVNELTFDYQLALQDDAGDVTTILIEKQTGVTAEPLDVGSRYRVTGISEFYQGLRQIKPRLQTDLVQVFPPVLAVAVRAANNVLPGEELVYTVTAVNHTDAPLTNVTITAVPPTENVTLRQDVVPGTPFVWTVDSLPGNGGEASFEYRVLVNSDAVEVIEAPAVTAVADQWPEPATTDPFLTFVGEGVPIWAIQGEGLRSPYVRGSATTVGVVTAVFPDLNGFWIQETETDDNPATSAGLFIFFEGGQNLVQVGDLVRVEGTVRERFEQTTLEPPDGKGITVLESGLALPDPVAYDPPPDPAAALAYKEAHEGMLVVVDTAVVVAPTTQYGEYVMVAAEWGVSHITRTEPVGYDIFVDDGSEVVHEDQATLPYAVQSGDLVQNLVGVLAFTFGHYKIEPTVQPEIVAGERPLPTLPLLAENQFSIATFNTENLFDLVDPHPSSPPRPTLDQYRLKLDKIAQTILAMGAPTIIGLQEVENIDILENIVELEALADFGYVPYLIEGSDSRGIDNAYLVRSDQATVAGISAYPAPEALTTRPPLIITVTLHLASGDQQMVLLNNHFTALSAGEEVTEPQRNGQAALNVSAMEQIRANNPDTLFVVMGDLNSFYDTLPIHTLQAAGLRHVYEFLAEPLPYTYIFEGRTQTLDHILLSEGLFAGVTAVTVLHLNADYPLASPDDTTAQHTSDHDPVVVLFSVD
ncbi:MAG: lamin tail domain-containing protein [Ardenticatenaceae bacterium]|nr:lamin tail domain-containing protein [Ardenticatenaceae bacterium]